MGHQYGRSAYKLTVINSRGIVLGTIVASDDDRAFSARCNDCPDIYDGGPNLLECIEWVETHQHHPGGLLASVSTERDDGHDERAYDGAMFS